MTRKRYIEAALNAAHYRILNDDEPHFGDVPALPGAWASGTTHEECREKLEKAIDEWIVVRENQNLSLPAIDGLKPKVRDGT
jgi:predicted RNase H-like HicB family nuclease